MNQGFYCATEHTCLYYVAGEEMDHGSNLWIWEFQALRWLGMLSGSWSGNCVYCLLAVT